MNFLAWLLSLIMAFSFGTQVGTREEETDDELRNRVQEHLDVIVDESAAILDDVTDAIREDERVKDAEEFFENGK